ILAADYVQEPGGHRQNLVLEGQERNLDTPLAIGKLNMLLHGLASARLVAGDVIAEPGLVDPQGRLNSYDRVIANPPFSMKNWGTISVQPILTTASTGTARYHPGPAATWRFCCTCSG
ncbi:MAG: N-6 DNA methylase, partial [Chloroflexi bacterium]|nr:N-6 DNA methylase [Chloroflexota bacterium]